MYLAYKAWNSAIRFVYTMSFCPAFLEEHIFSKNAYISKFISYILP